MPAVDGTFACSLGKPDADVHPVADVTDADDRMRTLRLTLVTALLAASAQTQSFDGSVVRDDSAGFAVYDFRFQGPPNGLGALYLGPTLLAPPQGFDTDTVAAIAAGILGARFGTSFVDVERLLDRGRLLDYAEALADRRAPADTEAQLVRGEAE